MKPERYQHAGGPTRIKTHGFYGTPTYYSWSGMRQRSNNPKNKDYKNYGARGIKVCERWEEFENFLEDMGVKPEGKSIDRIDNNKDYCKENCRWATEKQQKNNTRKNTFLTYKGETLTQAQWARRLGVLPETIGQRRKCGWTDKQIIETPVSYSNRNITHAKKI